MSATDELRCLLDERGVEYVGTHQAFTAWWGDHDLYWSAMEVYDGELDLGTNMSNVSPEQAIDATLGRGECRNASKVMDEHGQARFACSECGAWIDSRMLWNPEYRNGESPWVNDCKLNYCPNCGRKVVTDG